MRPHGHGEGTTAPNPQIRQDSHQESPGMTSDPDPFEQGQRAARENIPADSNPYQDGSQEHALWAAGHEQIAGAAETEESEGT